MICEICKNVEFLKQRAKAVSKEEAPALGQDMLDTLEAHRSSCVGMAANMIGIAKSAIIVNIAADTGSPASALPGISQPGYEPEVMFNPKLIRVSPKTYDTEEGCLSLAGVRPVRRHQWVEINYRNIRWQKKQQRYEGFIAEIIQHEIDHLDGKII